MWRKMIESDSLVPWCCWLSTFPVDPIPARIKKKIQSSWKFEKKKNRVISRVKIWKKKSRVISRVQDSRLRELLETEGRGKAAMVSMATMVISEHFWRPTQCLVLIYLHILVAWVQKKELSVTRASSWSCVRQTLETGSELFRGRASMYEAPSSSTTATTKDFT